MEVLGGFALYKDGVVFPLEDGVHREEIRPAQMLERGYESTVGFQAFIPPAELGGKGCGDKDLIHRRVESNPGETPREGGGVIGEESRPVGVLEVADPV